MVIYEWKDQDEDTPCGYRSFWAASGFPPTAHLSFQDANVLTWYPRPSTIWPLTTSPLFLPPLFYPEPCFHHITRLKTTLTMPPGLPTSCFSCLARLISSFSIITYLSQKLLSILHKWADVLCSRLQKNLGNISIKYELMIFPWLYNRTANVRLNLRLLGRSLKGNVLGWAPSEIWILSKHYW